MTTAIIGIELVKIVSVILSARTFISHGSPKNITTMAGYLFHSTAYKCHHGGAHVDNVGVCVPKTLSALMR